MGMRLAQGRREQLKVFLMNKDLVDSFGNAYADEVCFAAGLHPKTLHYKPFSLNRFALFSPLALLPFYLAHIERAQG